MLSFILTVNQGYSKDELQDIFHTNFGSRIKGITLRKTPDNEPYALVFSRADGPYADRVEGRSFYYDGEGRDKDQTLTAANKALVEANNTGRTIFGFRQEEAGGPWLYMGILYVVDYSYVLKNGFMTYEFHFESDPVNPEDVQAAYDAIGSVALQAPALTEPAPLKSVTIRARKAAFRNKVKDLYGNTCAVCRLKRLSAAGYPEVEAAHIYPKEKMGSDDYRNGIALCRLHHWAFDAGLLIISDELTIITSPDIESDPAYEQLTVHNGAKLLLPSDERYNPALLYIRAHRELHSFQNQDREPIQISSTGSH